jgi:hypothetical protein
MSEQPLIGAYINPQDAACGQSLDVTHGMTSTVLPKCLRLNAIAELDMLQLGKLMSVACQTRDCTLNLGRCYCTPASEGDQ